MSERTYMNIPGIEDILIPEKNPERVHRCYDRYPTDFKAQYDMLLPDGKKCADCYNSSYCKAVFGGNDENAHCQFHPSRYFEDNE